ncbi:MAG TPA: DUF1385 domain-containing protein [Abditibacteriaceae bacterium]|jgi:uncharacterized protein YqhQ
MPQTETPQPATAGEKPSFNLGGQALIEGVMMRSPRFLGAAVRRADGTIETRVERFDSVLIRHRWLRIPFLRGIIALVEMMFVGMKYLNWSSQLALLDNDAPRVDVTQSVAATTTDMTSATSAVPPIPVVTPDESALSPGALGGNSPREEAKHE